VTTTETATAPSITGVQVTPTTAPTESSETEVPWWAWLLIGLGVVIVVGMVYGLGRHHGEARPSGGSVPPTTGPAGPEPPGDVR
jgi:hypothetical protein